MVGQSEPAELLFKKHQKNGVLLDTNLLLLLALGGLDGNLIGKGRVSDFMQEDFNQLNTIAQTFHIRWTTPNIMTEVDNLGRQNTKGRSHLFKAMLGKIELVSKEEYIDSRTIFSNIKKDWLGLSDEAILHFKPPFLLITADFNLWNNAIRSGLDAVNWNHFRQRWM